MHFITIYAREAHPIPGGRAGQYSYDTDGNPIAQPETYEERVVLASKAVSEAHIDMIMLVDEIDNPLWCSYGQMPNNAYFIGRDGRIILYQEWNKVAEMEAAITTYLARSQTVKKARKS